MFYKYGSSKTWNFLGSTSYRQHKADTHCNQDHGYAMSFYAEFGSHELDVRNWVVDFGSLRPFKEKLEEWFDHTKLVASDDPHKEVILSLGKLGIAKVVEVEATGCEALATFLYDYLNGVPEMNYTDGFLNQLGYSKVWCTKFMVTETPGNSGWRALTLEEYVARNTGYPHLGA